VSKIIRIDSDVLAVLRPIKEELERRTWHRRTGETSWNAALREALRRKGHKV